MIDRGFRGIEVLRTLIVFIELSRSKTQDLRIRIFDWPEHAPSESVIAAFVASHDKSSCDQLLTGEAQASQMFQKVLPTLRCITNSKTQLRRIIKSSTYQEVSGESPLFSV